MATCCEDKKDALDALREKQSSTLKIVRIIKSGNVVFLRRRLKY